MIRTTKPARAWRRSMHPARCAPAAGTAMVTCVATVRPRAGRPTPTSRTFTPSRAVLCRVPCGGSSRRRNSRDQHRPQFIRPGAGGVKNPGAAVAAPGVEGKQPLSERRRLRWAQAAALTASLWYAMPSGAGRCQHREHAAPDGAPCCITRCRVASKAPAWRHSDARCTQTVGLGEFNII